MDLLKLATQYFIERLGANGGGLNEGAVSSALGGLLGSGDGNIDLGSIISKLDGVGLASLAQSWLGDGANDVGALKQAHVGCALLTGFGNLHGHS